MSTGCSHMMKSGKRAGTNCGGKITALCNDHKYCCKHRVINDGKVNVKDLSKTKVVKTKKFILLYKWDYQVLKHSFLKSPLLYQLCLLRKK